ncbi:hypothetical protein [Thermosulfurimonas sp. F29]|uniref:hypothetical protein n=1 Tax=Thermosulfurimonas sp. F29 TaxID=2867247 RepID=UPI00351D5092
MQWVGTDVVRRRDPNFWVEHLEEQALAAMDDGHFVLIEDGRMENELALCEKLGFLTVGVSAARKFASTAWSLRASDPGLQIKPEPFSKASCSKPNVSGTASGRSRCFPPFFRTESPCLSPSSRGVFSRELRCYLRSFRISSSERPQRGRRGFPPQTSLFFSTWTRSGSRRFIGRHGSGADRSSCWWMWTHRVWLSFRCSGSLRRKPGPGSERSDFSKTSATPAPHRAGESISFSR